MNESVQAITVANDESLVAMIHDARRRLVILAPGFSKPVAEAIVDAWKRLGPDVVSVIADVDAEVYRLGYGDFDALKRLEEVAASFNTTLNRQPGIRIGLVIADDETLVYSPTPLLIETGPKSPQTPNAIRLGTPPVSLSKDLGQGPNGVRDQKVGLDKAEKSKIEDVGTRLAENPPQEFDVARTVRVFNTYFEFVEFHLKDVAIHKKKVTLPKHIARLTGDSQLDDIISPTMELIRQDRSISGKSLEWYRAMDEGQGVTQLNAPRNDLLFAKAAGGHQPIVQTPGRAELHHEVKAILVTEMVVERYDVRMIELGESLHLPQQVAVVALFWSRENLNRDFPVGDRLVVGEIHLAEAAATKPASDKILVVQFIADRDHYRTPHELLVGW